MEAVPTRVTTLLVHSLVPAQVVWSCILGKEVVKVKDHTPINGQMYTAISINVA